MTTTEPAELKPCPPMFVGTLVTLNDDTYPGLGEFFVQLRNDNNPDEVVARIYGADPNEVYERARAICEAANTRASTPPAPVADDAVCAMNQALDACDDNEHMELPEYANWVISELAKRGYHLTRQPAMTDTELEREAHELSYLTRDFKCVVGIDDAINLAKKYRR